MAPDTLENRANLRASSRLKPLARGLHVMRAGQPEYRQARPSTKTSWQKPLVKIRKLIKVRSHCRAVLGRSAI